MNFVASGGGLQVFENGKGVLSMHYLGKDIKRVCGASTANTFLKEYKRLRTLLLVKQLVSMQRLNFYETKQTKVYIGFQDYAIDVYEEGMWIDADLKQALEIIAASDKFKQTLTVLLKEHVQENKVAHKVKAFQVALSKLVIYATEDVPTSGPIDKDRSKALSTFLEEVFLEGVCKSLDLDTIVHPGDLLACCALIVDSTELS